jgi:hypothetical protein
MVKILYPKEMDIRQAPVSDFAKDELIEFAQKMRQYPPSFGMARGLLPAGMLDGNRAIIEAFKKRTNI